MTRDREGHDVIIKGPIHKDIAIFNMYALDNRENQ